MSITLQEAEKVLNVDKKTKRIEMVSESTNYFIFNIVPVDLKSDFERPLIPATAVEKSTGRKLAFNPMYFSKEELKSIKRIR